MNAVTRRGALAGLALLGATPAVARQPAARVSFFATASGLETLDGPDGSGNPFATALIETMARSDLSFAEACAALAARTATLSDGAMHPDIRGTAGAPAWRFAANPRERREALVLVVSDYSASDSAPSLPGAATDAARMVRAFAAAGFATTRVENPTRASLGPALAAFSHRSAGADVAALYCTGHGVEVDGVQYVLFGDHRVADGIGGLARAARWADIAAAPRARRLNLTFWAGCRNNPFA